MYVAIAILGFFLILIAAVLFSPFRFAVIYEKENVIIKMGIKKVLFTVFNSQNQKSPKKNKDYIKFPKISLDVLKKKFNIGRNLYEREKHEIISILQQFNRTIKIISFNIALDFGFGDAAVTGIANGIIWSAILAITGIINRYLAVKNKTNIAIFPNYINQCFDLKVSLFFETNVCKFISIIIRIKKTVERNNEEIKILKDGGLNG